MSYILLAISAIAKAVMDHCAIGTWSGWWNKNESWKNKWKEGSTTEEAFLGSSTFLVWLTDGWHFFQMIFLNFLFLGLLLQEEMFNLWLDFIILAIGYKIIFELSYRLLK